MKVIQESIKLSAKQKRGKCVFRLIEFQDHGHWVVYIPSLNLSAYGDTLVEAHKMMGEVVLDDFFETLLEQPDKVIFSKLQELGWTKSPFFDKELSNNTHVDRNGILKNFNLPENTDITEKLVEA